MHDIIFYIFASVVLISVLFIAFTGSIENSLKGFAYFIAGICELLILSNSQLLSLLFSLLLLIIFFASYLFKDKIKYYLIGDTGIFSKTNILSLLIISLVTALLSSLLGSARWQMVNIDYSLNSFVMIFTKYLPVIFAVTLLLSAMIPIVFRITKLTDVKS